MARLASSLPGTTKVMPSGLQFVSTTAATGTLSRRASLIAMSSLFVIDTNKEDIAIKEARRLNVPVAAVVDTNCNPDGITFVVPGNDDAGRAITLYCDLIAKAAIDGISRAQGEHGIDIGAAEK